MPLTRAVQPEETAQRCRVASDPTLGAVPWKFFTRLRLWTTGRNCGSLGGQDSTTEMRKGGACKSAFTRQLSAFCLTLLGHRPYLLQERHDIKIVAYFLDLASFDSVHEGRGEVFHTPASGRDSAPRRDHVSAKGPLPDHLCQ